MTRIYIAGSSQEVPRARAAMGIARECGFQVTQDWTQLGGEGVDDADLSRAERATIAGSCAYGINLADVVWCLLPTTESRGLWWEMGFARGCQQLLIASGPHGSVFSELVDVYRKTDAEALVWLLDRYGRRQPDDAAAYDAAKEHARQGDWSAADRVMRTRGGGDE